MAGIGGLPSAHTAAIKSSIAAASANGNSNSNSTKHLSSLNVLNPLRSQHRNRSLKARVARACPSLIHSSTRRKRSLLIMLCTGGIVVMIYFLSVWDSSKFSSAIPDRFSRSPFSSRSAPPEQQQQKHDNGNNFSNTPLKDKVVYINPDGTDMDPKSIFMIRDFGSSVCHHAFSGLKRILPQDMTTERERARAQNWKLITRADAWQSSLAWKRSLKRILPNWKQYSSGWVGQGVVLSAFGSGVKGTTDTVADLLVQIKLIRSLSSIPIEVWFEQARDVTEELQESIVTWGAIVRSLDDDVSTIQDAIVHSSDSEAIQGSLEPPIRKAEIQEIKARVGPHSQIQFHKALTVAALINSGFEDIIYFAPSTLPTTSPRIIFQQPGYQRTGAMFWQHPTLFPAHDSPIWPMIQADCIPHAYEQSWSAFAIKHKDSWKGLFLAWYWLTGPEAVNYTRIFDDQANDLLRLAWVAVGRQFVAVDRMPQAGLLDLSNAKGDGIGCNLGSNLYPSAGSDVLENPTKYQQDQRQQQKLFQKSYRYGAHDEFFIENRNVMMIDTGSTDRRLYRAIDHALGEQRDPIGLVLTDAYVAGPDGKVCMRMTRAPRDHRHP
ncbi:hypothetical protein BGX28_004905 [Mortierella sp. GBA30]|nr:hypothetical protein BGX28_004905 [Mortierella sp. GBA30]